MIYVIFGNLVVVFLFSGCASMNVQKYFYPSYWEAKEFKKQLWMGEGKRPYNDERLAKSSMKYATALSYYNLDPNNWEQIQDKIVPTQFSDGVYYCWEIQKYPDFRSENPKNLIIIKYRIALGGFRITFRTPNPSNIDDVMYIQPYIYWYNDTFRIDARAGSDFYKVEPQWEIVP